MIGYFVIDSFINETDNAGFSTKVNVSSAMDMNLKYILFLPPYLRKVSCDISEGDKVFGVADDTSGLGVALCGLDGADFGYFFDTDIQIKQNLSITGNAAVGGDSTVNGNSAISGNSTVSGNVTAQDCRITIAAIQIPNPNWVDDGNQTDPDSHGNPRYITKPAAVSSLAQHTHTCAAPGSPTTPPIPTPVV